VLLDVFWHMPADDAPGVGGPAAAARHALAAVLQQWLPACLDKLLLPAEGDTEQQQQQQQLGLAGGSYYGQANIVNCALNATCTCIAFDRIPAKCCEEGIELYTREHCLAAAAAVCATAAYASSSLGRFLTWLWPQTAAPAAAQRTTAQQVLSILAQELLAAAAADGGGGAAGGGEAMEVDRPSTS
jgi:hypothetical protein